MLTRYVFPILLIISFVPASAAEPDAAVTEPVQAVFGFGGIFTKENMGASARPFRTSYEDNILLGAGYQRFVYRLEDYSFGLEAGASVRLGGRPTGEVWAGAVGRYDGLPAFADFQVTPAFTFGLSAVSGTHRGRELALEERYDGDASVLVYLGPEINVSHASFDHEVFWRLHHRSGAWGTLGNMKGAMNANVIGLRRNF